MDASIRVKRVGPASAAMTRPVATSKGAITELDPAQTVTPVPDGAASSGRERACDLFDWRQLAGEVLLDPNIREALDRDAARASDAAADARAKLRAYQAEAESPDGEKTIFERTV
jgi:hypothetical protein